MSLQQEVIVYLWLAPVVLQICLPLALLGGWFATELLRLLRGKPLPVKALQS
jgi:hypothetical protein